MTDLAREQDSEERQPEDLAPAEELAADTAAAPADQTEQDALFEISSEPAPEAASAGDEGMTAFGGQPDDLAAIRMELGTDEPGEPAEEPPSEEAQQPAVADEAEQPVAESAEAVVEAQASAEDEASEAVVEAGVPEGADDDPDAVEALLDEETAEGLLERPDRTLWLPFLLYDAVWLVFAITMVLTLRTAATANALDAAAAYPVFVLVALVLTVAGPLLAVLLWWLVRSRTEPEERGGLFATAMLRGALATFAGVAMWWVARVVLDFLRTGRFF
jgi:hypothetical protein